MFTVSSRSKEIRSALARILEEREKKNEAETPVDGFESDGLDSVDQELAERAAVLKRKFTGDIAEMEAALKNTTTSHAAAECGESPADTNDNGEQVYSLEQQARLGIDAHGKKVDPTVPRLFPQHSAGGAQDLPAKDESISNVKDLPSVAIESDQQTSMTAAEEQKRLVIQENEQLQDNNLETDAVKNETPSVDDNDGKTQALPPAWITGNIEPPAGEKNHGDYTTRVYTAEQQSRLGVDEQGNKVSVTSGGISNADVQVLPPAWLSGGIEPPAGQIDHGTYKSLVYTAEQQKRLGVDQEGRKHAVTSSDTTSSVVPPLPKPKLPENNDGQIEVGNTIHTPFKPYPAADEVFNDDDAALGQKCPDLSSLKYVQGDTVKIGDGRAKIVFFWGKYLKWQCWPIVSGMCEITEKHSEVDIIGIAADKKLKDVERFIEKGECRMDNIPLAFDENWVVKDSFRELMRVGALAVPCAFLIDGDGKIVWRQAYSAGYPFASMGFYSQLLCLLSGNDLKSHCKNPNPEEEIEDVGEAKDVFATQEVKDAIW